MTQKQSQREARKEKTAAQAQIRRDAVALLEYLRDHNVTGTQSSGNLPLQAIREINAFLDPPMVLDEKIGNHVYHLRSEFDVWRIYFPHVLAMTAGLVTGGIARRVRLTPQGDAFLVSDAEHQLWTLLNTWWYRIDWVMAFPVSGLAKGLPPRFSTHVLDLLRRLPVGKRISFAQFADLVIATTGLTWPSADVTFHRTAMHTVVRTTVVNILSYFGAVGTYLRPKRIGKGSIKELSQFRITPSGDRLLRSLR